MPLDETRSGRGADSAAEVEIVHSACPPACPSTCSLEVERIDAHTIGRVHGASGQGYTAGVVCAKVARYAERIHHPDRLMRPLRRTGEKGSGRDGFEAISWEDALDAVAEGLTLAAQRDGAGSGLAVFLCRHDGVVAARWYSAAAPHDGLFAPALYLLYRAVGCWLERRHWCQPRR